MEVFHDGVVVIGYGADSEHLFHDILDCFLVFRIRSDFSLHQQFFDKRFFGNKADQFLISLIDRTDGGQPVHIVFDEPVRRFHEAVLHGLHGSLHVHPAVVGDESQHIIQRVDVHFPSAFKVQRELVRCLKHLPDVRFPESCFDIRKLMINRLHQPSNRLVDAAGHFFGAGPDGITVDIDDRVLQVLGQIHLGISAALAHLHAFRLLFLYFEIDPDLL